MQSVPATWVAITHAEALLNFLGLMGWSMPDGREKFTFAEMSAAFSWEGQSCADPAGPSPFHTMPL